MDRKLGSGHDLSFIAIRAADDCGSLHIRATLVDPHSVGRTTLPTGRTCGLTYKQILKHPQICPSGEPLRPLRCPEAPRILDRSGVFPQPVSVGFRPLPQTTPGSRKGAGVVSYGTVSGRCGEAGVHGPDTIPKLHPLAVTAFKTLQMRLIKIAARTSETATRVHVGFTAACRQAVLVSPNFLLGITLGPVEDQGFR